MERSCGIGRLKIVINKKGTIEVKCNKCKGELVNVSIIEVNGRGHNMLVCTECGLIKASRKQRIIIRGMVFKNKVYRNWEYAK